MLTIPRCGILAGVLCALAFSAAAARAESVFCPEGDCKATRESYKQLCDFILENRSNLKKIFHDLQESGAKKIVFAGADEVAEIAYITLQEAGMDLSNVVDEELAGKKFFGKTIQPMHAVQAMPHDCIVVTSYLN